LLTGAKEYLGDWVNLMGHQRAALHIVTQLFTPQTAMSSFVTRTILTWYVRFDVFVGMLGGFETRLPREWFSTCAEYYETQLAQGPDNLAWKIDYYSASIRLITVDMSRLYAKTGRGEISGDAFAAEHRWLEMQLKEWKASFERSVIDREHLVTDFSYKVPLTEDNIVDPYAAGFLYDLPLFSTTILLCEWHSILVMHKSQEAFALQQEPSQELTSLAYNICQIFETIERWPYSPNGAIVLLQSCLAISTLFLPKDQKHNMWVRRKFASIEALG
jgi:hypothetical protein